MRKNPRVQSIAVGGKVWVWHTIGGSAGSGSRFSGFWGSGFVLKCSVLGPCFVLNELPSEIFSGSPDVSAMKWQIADSAAIPPVFFCLVVGVVGLCVSVSWQFWPGTRRSRGSQSRQRRRHPALVLHSISQHRLLAIYTLDRAFPTSVQPAGTRPTLVRALLSQCRQTTNY